MRSKLRTAREKDFARRWVGEACTLNGSRAIVTGRQLDFAIVAALDGPLRVEYAWQTVETVMVKGGAFNA